MNRHRLAGVLVACLFFLAAAVFPRPGFAAPPDEPVSADAAPLFRVFLTDGTTLVSYGELARVDDRVVFSMPTSTSAAAPQLQLVNIAADKVDWPRTASYAESARASRYLATRAESDYTLLTTEIAQALNDVALTDEPVKRLAIVERARKTLADWPAAHYDYKHQDVQQLLGMLDEAIAELRAAAGASSFDLNFVAASGPPPAREPLLPPPSVQEIIEQTIAAAGISESPAERMSLLTIANHALETEAAALPAEWSASTKTMVVARIAHETEIDRRYKAMRDRTIRLAATRARMADVRGVQRVLSQIADADAALGRERPDTIAGITAAVEEQLDAARRLRLERDRWALRVPALRTYRASIGASLVALQRMTPLLEDIKLLAGSGPQAIRAIANGAMLVTAALRGIQPPDELREAHGLLVSAAQLADSAASIREEAALTGSMPRAWDASSAAAGALMLASKARTDIQLALRLPQLAK